MGLRRVDNQYLSQQKSQFEKKEFSPEGKSAMKETQVKSKKSSIIFDVNSKKQSYRGAVSQTSQDFRPMHSVYNNKIR